MRIAVYRNMIVVGACLLNLACAWGQTNTGPEQTDEGRAEIGVSVEAAHANTVAAYDFWMEGGGLDAAMKIGRHWSGAAGTSWLHTGQMPNATVGLNLFTATFGPRYTLALRKNQFKIYGQAMGGGANGSNSLFPNPKGATSSASGVAMLLGGGADYRVSSRISARLLEADWLRTSLSNGTTTVQNSLRIRSGLVLRF